MKSDFDVLNSGFTANIVRSFLYQGAAILFCLIAMFMPFGFVGVSLAAIVATIGYVYFGYKYLLPLPKWNLLSLSFLAMGLGLLSGYFYFADLVTVTGEPNFLMIVNYPAMYLGQLILLALSAVFRSDNFAYEHLSSLALAAAFIPSLFMYAGLRAKIYKQNKS
ncbi:MAG: hypothetical protein FWF11_01235 [Coriobacteriia bacterium]|nr:hypothetical protein [Coriobacteriia bacterium]